MAVQHVDDQLLGDDARTFRQWADSLLKLWNTCRDGSRLTVFDFGYVAGMDTFMHDCVAAERALDTYMTGGMVPGYEGGYQVFLAFAKVLSATQAGYVTTDSTVSDLMTKYGIK